jgi:hypothetical protein
MSKLAKLFLATLALWLLGSLGASAQTSVTFLNNDGTITASGGNDLTLTGSTLAGISNLGMGYDCPPPTCSGTVGLTTGHTMTSPAGSLTSNATFGPGGTFSVASNTGPGGGFTFTGSFSSATWTKSGSGATEFWTFVGTIANGMLTLNTGQVFTNINGATIDLTTLGGPKPVGGFNTWTDSGGTTTFPSPIPEPGTLTLMGSGLVGLGWFARRFRVRKTTGA